MTQAEKPNVLTDADLDAIESRLDAATPGPWEHRTVYCFERRMSDPDADLVAHAPTTRA